MIDKVRRRIKIYTKSYNTREFKVLLKKNGFEQIRTTGGHSIFRKGERVISINNKLNKMICKRLIKENNLMEGENL